MSPNETAFDFFHVLDNLPIIQNKLKILTSYPRENDNHYD